MKKILLGGFTCLLLAFSAEAASVVLIYKNEAAVQQGEYSYGTVVTEGILVSAKVVMEAGGTPLVGRVGGPLTKGVLIRLDNVANVALLEEGAPLSDRQLQEAHRSRSEMVARFVFPQVSTANISSVFESSAPLSLALVPKEPFQVKINGILCDGTPLTLPVHRKESEFKLEIVRTGDKKIWAADVELTSNPPLSFWKESETKSLNNVPTKKFTYDYQAMFGSFSKGESFKVSVEVYFIKQESYEWTIHVTSKDESIEKKISVIFKEE
jgi:hypothetical protein